MKDVREIFTGDGIMVKTGPDGVVKRIIEGARLISGPDMESDEIIVDSGDHGTAYLVDSEEVVISKEGEVTFEALGAKYLIRKITKDDNLANLNPEPEDTAKVKFVPDKAEARIAFSEVPAPLQKLIKEMIERVELKIGPEDAEVATADMKKFVSGSGLYSQSDISFHMAALLRHLT